VDIQRVPRNGKEFETLAQGVLGELKAACHQGTEGNAGAKVFPLLYGA